VTATMSPAAIFDRAELTARADRARRLAAEAGLDALLVTGDFAAGMNYFYLSGHLPRDFQLNYSRPHVMVLPVEGDAFAYVYGINVENAKDMGWVDDVVAYAPPFSGAGLADVLRARGLGTATIGVELGVDQRIAMPVGDFLALRDGLPGASFVDAAGVLWALRAIKSDPEIALIEVADAINGAALARAFARIKPGDTEVDAARAVGASLIEEGAFRPPYGQLNLVSQAKSRALGHRARMLGPLGEFTLEEGDLLFVDSGVVVGGYWGEFNRMAVVGEPSAEQRGHHDAIREIVRRSVADALKPGVPFREVIERMASYYRDLGYAESQFANYLGPPFMHLCHGLGLASSEPPFVRHDSDGVLEPGMVLSCEAYLTADGMTYGSEEDVVITAEGNRVLSSRDPGLFVIGG
jgi:Xaa-Pro dipeptidase